MFNRKNRRLTNVKTINSIFDIFVSLHKKKLFIQLQFEFQKLKLIIFKKFKIVKSTIENFVKKNFFSKRFNKASTNIQIINFFVVAKKSIIKLKALKKKKFAKIKKVIN